MPRNSEERDLRAIPIIAAQFNTISRENARKRRSIHPKQDHLNFDPADHYVAFGETI